MADTNSNPLGLLLMEEGSHSNEWGDLNNLNLDRIASATRGYAQISLAGVPYVMDTTDIATTSSTAQEESFFSLIEFAGTGGSTVEFNVQPTVWTVRNITDGIISVFPTGGTGFSIARNTTRKFFYSATDTELIDITDEMNDPEFSAWTIVTANNQPELESQVILDSSGGSFTITLALPIEYTTQRREIVLKTYQDAETNAVTLTTALGEPINGAVEDLILDLNYQTLHLVYTSAEGWVF